MTMHAKRIARRATALLIAVTLALPVTALAAETPAKTKSAGDVVAPATQATQSGPNETSDDCDPTVERAMTLKQGESAAQGTGAGAGESSQSRSGLSEQRRQQIKNQVRDRLRTRANHFSMAEGVLAERVDRIAEIAALVEGAGEDVSEVYALLDEARALIAQAEALEAEAVELFNSIADSDDPRATFVAARDKAREAVMALRDARTKLHEAVEILSGMIDGLT